MDGDVQKRCYISFIFDAMSLSNEKKDVYAYLF
jgi:hypothetical protein